MLIMIKDLIKLRNYMLSRMLIENQSL